MISKREIIKCGELSTPFIITENNWRRERCQMCKKLFDSRIEFRSCGYSRRLCYNCFKKCIEIILKKAKMLEQSLVEKEI